MESSGTQAGTETKASIQTDRVECGSERGGVGWDYMDCGTVRKKRSLVSVVALSSVVKPGEAKLAWCYHQDLRLSWDTQWRYDPMKRGPDSERERVY